MPLDINLPTARQDGASGHTAGHNATNTAVNSTAAAVDAHGSGTTDVHGIADTSVLATDAEVSAAVAAHAAASDPHAGYVKETITDAAGEANVNALVRTIQGDRADFTEVITQTLVAQGAGTFTNTVWGFGYGMTPSFTRAVAGEPMFRIGMEGSFWDQARGETLSELHFGAFIDPNAPTETEVRPFTIEVEWSTEQGGTAPSPNIGFTIGESGSAPFAISNIDGDVLLQYASGLWQWSRGFLLLPNASNQSLLIMGGGDATDAQINLNADGTNGTCAIYFQKDSANKWLLYQAAGSAELFVRDMVNSRMLLTFNPGASVAAARVDVNGGLQADGHIRTQVATTAGRPSASDLGVGAQIYDSTLSQPIWSDGSVWRFADGTAA